MRVATWNMNYWRRTPDQLTAAGRLLQELQIDVALLQEAAPPCCVGAVFREGGIDSQRKRAPVADRDQVSMERTGTESVDVLRQTVREARALRSDLVESPRQPQPRPRLHVPVQGVRRYARG